MTASIGGSYKKRKWLIERSRFASKKEFFFFFDSFDLMGLKNFIIQDDKKLINRILFGTEKF